MLNVLKYYYFIILLFVYLCLLVGSIMLKLGYARSTEDSADLISALSSALTLLKADAPITTKDQEKFRKQIRQVKDSIHAALALIQKSKTISEKESLKAAEKFREIAQLPESPSAEVLELSAAVKKLEIAVGSANVSGTASSILPATLRAASSSRESKISVPVGFDSPLNAAVSAVPISAPPVSAPVPVPSPPPALTVLNECLRFIML